MTAVASNLSTLTSINTQTLKTVGLFGGLSDDSLRCLAQELPQHHIEAGTLVVREGMPSYEMFIVMAGELEVYKAYGSGQSNRIARLGPRDWFGEMAILDTQPRSASVLALSPSLLMSMRPGHVRTLLYQRNNEDYALFMMNIARELSRRLRTADTMLGNYRMQLSRHLPHNIELSYPQ